MVEKRKLAAIADIMRDYVSIGGEEKYYSETGIVEDDFIPIHRREFDGNIFAIDGSNVVLFDWAVANVNHIRAGYVVYKGTEWQRTVITYDDLFVADKKNYRKEFDLYLKGIFGLEGLDLSETELDRLTSYFRELQEYIALYVAISEAGEGDLVLYDGGFHLWVSPYQKVLDSLFQQAEKRGVDTLGISKSSTFSWGADVSRPFIQNTHYFGSKLIPNMPWYIDLMGRNIDPKPDGSWAGGIYVAKFHEDSDRGFRVDVPIQVVDHIDTALGHIARYSNSAESLGYPHALFRAHREIRIQDEERRFLRFELMDELGRAGFNESKLRSFLVDYHETLEMRSLR